jgi:hypothetical protein
VAVNDPRGRANACKRAARSAVVTLNSWPRLKAPPMAVPGDQAAGCGTDAAGPPRVAHRNSRPTYGFAEHD